MSRQSYSFSGVLAGFLFLIICPFIWGDNVNSQAQNLQKAFWSAMSEQRYSEAGEDIEGLLVQDPQNQEYKFQKAEWLWESQSPSAAILWLSQQEQSLDKNEIVNFLNKMLSKFSKRDWIKFYVSLIQSHRPELNVVEAAILTREFSARADAQRTFLSYRHKLLKNFNHYPISLQFYVAVLVEKYGFPNEAQKLYQVILTNHSTDKNTGTWIAKVYMRQKKYKEARRIVDRGLKEDLDSYQLLLLSGELLESERDFLSAIKGYNRLLRLYPSNQGALNVKTRALMNLGANSLVIEELSQNPQSDPVLLQRARGNIAMNYIRWDELEEASLALASKVQSKKKDYERARNFKVAFDPQAVKVENNRSRWDSMSVLFKKDKFQEVIAQYEQAVSEGLEVPVWVLKTVADSYLYKHQPEKALTLYQYILKQEPDSFEAKIALYYTWVDLGRFEEANELLESMDRREPVQVMDRGILKDNEHKTEIAYNKIWLLMYQDRLREAQKTGEPYFNRAPDDIQLRSAMAHLSLRRGWPRRSLQEFRVIRTTNPMFVPGSIGYARALYDNMHKKEAREFMKSLYEQYPQNRHVAHAKHLMDIDDRGLLTVNGYYTREMPGEDEFSISTRVDQPITDQHQFSAELIRRETTRDGGNDLTERFYAGDIYRPNNTWKLTNALTGDYRTGEKLGGISEIEMTPDDYWTQTFHYDSRTIDVPLRSRAAGIDVQDYKFSSRYRHSESFNTGGSVDFRNFEDGNANWNYAWTTDSAVATYAYWKGRLGTEFNYSAYSQQDVDYYSPAQVYNLYLIPNVEHVWYQRYEKRFLDRFFVGVGRQWEKNFGAENVGYLRYEIEYRHSDTSSFILGTVYSLKNYDGQDTNALNIYTTVEKRF